MLDFFLHFLIFNIIVSSKHTVHTTSQPVSNQSANNKQEHLISTRSVLSDTGDTIIVLSVKQRDAEKWKQMQSLFHWTAYSAKLQHKNKKPDHLIHVFCLFCFLPVIHSFSFLLSFFLFYFFIYIFFLQLSRWCSHSRMRRPNKCMHTSSFSMPKPHHARKCRI